MIETKPAARVRISQAGNQLFGQDENRKSGDPEQIHDSAYEQQRHQRPAAADAINPVANAQGKGTFDIAFEPAHPLQEGEWRLALREARIFQRQPLVQTGNQQKTSDQKTIFGNQHRRNQCSPCKGGLRQACNRGEGGPGSNVAPANQPVAANGFPCALACRPTRA